MLREFEHGDGPQGSLQTLADLHALKRSAPPLAPATRAFLDRLDRPVHLQVFVTPTCPYCPRAVALASPHVRADMVEVLKFPDLADRYHVYGVPRSVINDTVAVEGAVPERLLLAHLEEATAVAA